MTLPRTQLATMLATALPGVRIIPYAVKATLTSDTLMLSVAKVAPSTAGRARDYEIAVLAVVPYLDPATSEDALDALLEDVLLVLDTELSPVGIRWTTATRVVYADTWPAYDIRTSFTAAP